ENRAQGGTASRMLASDGRLRYGQEAAAVIIDLVRSYPDAFAFWNALAHEPAILRPDERVYFEAFHAFKKIGTPGIAPLLSHAKHANVRAMATEMLADYRGLFVPPDAVPTLIAMVLSEKENEHDLA